MPSIGFTVLKEKILSKEKRQTIRKARKRPIKVGDTLYFYWHLRRKDCQRLGVGICSETFRVPWKAIKNEEIIARLDGFANASEMREWFKKIHNPSDDTLFDIIRW